MVMIPTLMETIWLPKETIAVAEVVSLDGPFLESGWGLWDEAVAKLDAQIAAQKEKQ